MSSPPIVIDTCSFRDSNFVRKLATFHGRKVISTIAYSEMQVYLMYRKKKDSSYFDKILNNANIEIQDFSRENGLQTAIFGKDMGNFSKLFRDYAIASHAYLPPWIVVTNNKRDFEFMGERVMSPNEFMEKFMI